MKIIKIRLLVLGLCLSVGGFAATITENTTGPVDNSAGYFGQSFTTPGSGPWNNITVNFATTAGTPVALGTLYLFTAAYSGTPAALSGAGAFATSVSIVSNQWTFASGVSLASSTLYFFYSDALFGANAIGGSASNPYAGGFAFFAGSSASPFGPFAAQDARFNVSGTSSAVPEPATYATLAAGMLLVGYLRKR